MSEFSQFESQVDLIETHQLEEAAEIISEIDGVKSVHPYGSASIGLGNDGDLQVVLAKEFGEGWDIEKESDLIRDTDEYAEAELACKNIDIKVVPIDWTEHLDELDAKLRDVPNFFSRLSEII